MSTYKSDFLNTLSTRGYIHQCSDAAGLDALAAKGDVTAYIGFDCTAKSLHVGSLVQIMLLHWAQELGQKSIALMGGGTTRVGDPSGRDESRKLLTLEDIEDNKRGIQQVFAKFLRFGSGPKDALMIDNAEWLTKLNYLDMLRDIGRHFSVNRMLAMDSVKLRLEREHELSFIEFNYMVLQAYDFAELARRYGCNLQMGGSDQWGNIINGIDLGRRMGTHQLFALTTPLITLASGAKMGKTASGAVWLNADMLSPYGYWQFWRNTEDADVGRFLKLFTTLAPCRDRKTGRARWFGNQRSRRRPWPTRPPPCCTAKKLPKTQPRRRAKHLKKARALKACPPLSLILQQALGFFRRRCWRDLHHQMAKRAAPFRVVPFASMILRSATRKCSSRSRTSTAKA